MKKKQFWLDITWGDSAFPSKGSYYNIEFDVERKFPADSLYADTDHIRLWE